MSLIESALKKLQDRSGAQGAAVHKQRIAIGELADTSGAAQSAKRIQVSRSDLRQAGLLAGEPLAARLAGQYRRIKRPLLAAAFGRDAGVPDGHLMMVASALSGEGKSFTTINLAMSLALEKDISVLLVDADLAKPDISRVFGVSGEPGLVDALQSPATDIESYVIPTDVPGLSLLPAGRNVETATELLASGRMSEVVTRLGQVARRIVLFDSPPLLLTTESRVLSDVVSQVVYVVRAGVTTRRAVADALAGISEGKLISMVLNQSSGRDAGGSYGYGQYGTSPVGAEQQ